MIDWIDVNKRVPDNRRKVLTWGTVTLCGVHQPGRSQLLGDTRFNLNAGGGGRFDVERSGMLASVRVTHRAEITGPAERGAS